ncbi:MAG: hypothetical protein J6R25_04110 [Bacteroidales bacterium]|nr:hypothetical protein [Bacteroidales bacterium]
MAIFHKYPYTDIHDLNLDWILKVVKEMKDKFDSIDFDYIFNTLTALNNLTAQHTELLTQHQAEIDELGISILALRDDLNSGLADVTGSISTIETSISNLTTTVNNNTDAISQINSNISDINDTLTDLSGVTGDLADIEQDVDGLGVRVTALEQAAFGDISFAPVPKNFAVYMGDPTSVDYEIIKDYEVYDPLWSETVLIESGQFRFRGNSRYNQTHLVIKNFVPMMADNEPLTLAILFHSPFSYQYGQGLNTTFGALKSGVNCVVGVTTDICIGGAKLVANPDSLVVYNNAQIYDLHLYVKSQSGSDTYIANSAFLLDFIALLGGVGYLADGRQSADDVRKYMNNFNISTLGGASESEIEELTERVDDLEDDITSAQSDISTINGSISSIQSSISTINNKDASQDSSISSLGDRVSALESSESVETWDNWSDVFQEASITPNSRIIGFHMQKVGKIVTFEIAGCHFRNDSNHPYSTFCLGTLRSGLRSKLTPKGNIPVMFTGFVCDTDGNLTGIIQDGDTSHPEYTPLVPDAKGVCVMSLFGATTQVPYTWANRNNLAYSLNVNICEMGYQTAEASVSKNAFVVRGSYIAN